VVVALQFSCSESSNSCGGNSNSSSIKMTFSLSFVNANESLNENFINVSVYLAID